MSSLTEQLSHTEIFADLTDEQRAIIAPNIEVRQLPPGGILFKQMTDRLGMYLILKGECELYDADEIPHQVYVLLSTGKVLSERSLIEDTSNHHTLTCRACSDATVAFLSHGCINHLKQTEPALYTDMVVSMTRLLGSRLRNASRGPRGRGAAFRSGRTRREHDLLGDRDVPFDVLWGVQTLRAVENFDISGIRIDLYPEWIEALSLIKEACANANHQLGHLDADKHKAIVSACRELQKGMWHGHFVVDMIQGGAGTSTNMNANEVIANRALEILGHDRGEYRYLHPNTHVNMSQSTNDVYPSSIKIALLLMGNALLTEIDSLAQAFTEKGDEFKHIIKMGRTQLQDAVPMSLGQEFRAWGLNLLEGKRRIELGLESLNTLNMGGTAIGTGINTDPKYAGIVIEELQKLTKIETLSLAEDLVEETQDTSGFVELAGVFKMFAVRLSKICNDLRLLSSGPRCGLNEINLPAMQPGSSIMPGKVNPVIPEVVNQVAFQVIGLDTAVAMSAEAGQLELNVFEPLIAFNLFSSLHMMKRAVITLRERCIKGITANESHIQSMLDHSIGIVTALNPYLGYERTSEIAKEALATGTPVRALVVAKGYLTETQVAAILSPESMLSPTLLSFDE